MFSRLADELLAIRPVINSYLEATTRDSNESTTSPVIVVLNSQGLDGYKTAQAFVPRLPHFAYPTRTNGREEFIWTKFSAGAGVIHFLWERGV